MMRPLSRLVPEPSRCNHERTHEPKNGSFNYGEPQHKTQNRAVLASAPSGSASLRRLTAPPCAPSLANYETNVFYWPVKAQFSQKGERQNMSCSRRWQNLHGTGSGDAGESLDGNESIFSQRTHPFEPLLDDVQVAKLLGLHQKTVQKLARSGDIPAIHIGRYWRFRASSLQKWLDVKFSGQPLTKEIF